MHVHIYTIHAQVHGQARQVHVARGTPDNNHNLCLGAGASSGSGTTRAAAAGWCTRNRPNQVSASQPIGRSKPWLAFPLGPQPPKSQVRLVEGLRTAQHCQARRAPHVYLLCQATAPTIVPALAPTHQGQHSFKILSGAEPRDVSNMTGFVREDQRGNSVSITTCFDVACQLSCHPVKCNST